MANKLRPLYDCVIVKRIDSEEKTKGGIYISESAKEKPLEGEIIAVGQGCVLDSGEIRPLQVKAGDRVLFAKYAETEIKIEGENLLLLREDDLLGVLEG
jgi:chaperonin GroES